MSRGTQDAGLVESGVRYGALTRSGGPFQDLHVPISLVLPVLQPQSLLRELGLGSSRFARHYYGNLV